jgi:hypothetical protein
MSLRDKVSAFISGRAPKPICDACVADHLALSRRQVAAAGCTVQQGQGFKRLAGRCSGCCANRTVTIQTQDCRALTST